MLKHLPIYLLRAVLKYQPKKREINKLIKIKERKKEEKEGLSVIFN
jgi:hypothetical protein